MNDVRACVCFIANRILLAIFCTSISFGLDVAVFGQTLKSSVDNPYQQFLIKFVDEKGGPIAGVKISPAFFTGSKNDISPKITQYRSNEEGILSIPITETKGLIAVWAQKRGYVPIQTKLDIDLEKTISLELAPLYQGQIVDEKGQPVPNAKVYPYIESDDFREPVEPYIADENGLFQIRWKTDKANFFATDNQGNYARITDATFANNVLQLRSPTSLEVTVQDRNGNKIENASIQVRSWERCGTLKFSAISDGEGVAKFEKLPVGKLAIFLSCEGFRPQWIQIDSGQIKRTQVTLKRPQQITIRALDAETDQPIPEYFVTGYFFNELQVSESGPAVPSQLPESRGWGLRGEQGIATTLVERLYDKIDLKILAHDYSPASVIIRDSEEESIDRVVKLQKKPKGNEKIRVLGIDGTPAKDVSVMTQSEFRSSRIELQTSKDDALFDVDDRIHFTDNNGFASFDSIPFNGFLIAWNSEGYFQCNLAETDVTESIQLEPYATLRLRLPRFLYATPFNELESSLPSKIPSRLSTGLRPSWIAYQLFKLGENPERPYGIDEKGQIEMKVLPGTPAQIHFTYFQSKGVRTSQPLIEYQASPGDEIDIDLTGDSSIRGKIRFDWGTMQPKQLIAPLIYASTQNSNGTILYQAVVTNDGSFEFGQIPPGEYRLTMSMIAAEDDQAKAPQQKRITLSTQFTKSLTLGKTENCDLDELDVRLEVSPFNRR
ncbi:MAG: hypothetical protein ACK5YR_00110 [Pirellula sp.]